MARCAICGEDRKLTWEHVPPQSAYNNTPLLRRHMIVYPHHDKKYIKETSSTGEFERQTLCATCNSNTWYVDAYANFVKQMAYYADRCPSGRIAAHPNMDIILNRAVSAPIFTSLQVYPARVIKQALCMFCATCGTHLADEHPDIYPEIRKRILDRDSRGKIGGLRLWLYIRSVHGGMLTGLGKLYNIYSHRYICYSEVSFWPAGWVMTPNGEEMPTLCEVTHWLEYDYDDKETIWSHLQHGERVTDKVVPVEFPARSSDL